MEPTECFDSELQMCRLPAREPSMAWLRFWRWLAERGQLDHRVYGPPAGEYAAGPAGCD